MTDGNGRGGVVFSIVFIVGGLAILCGIWGPPLAAAVSARSWPESEAEVVFSQVGETPIGGNADPIVVFV